MITIPAGIGITPAIVTVESRSHVISSQGGLVAVRFGQ